MASNLKLRLWWMRLKWMAAGAVVLVVLAAAGAFIVIDNGLYDVTASSQHNASVAKVIHATFLHAVAQNASGVDAPGRFTGAQVARGLRLYVRHCETCHGGPGVARAAWVRGMNPTPPYLLDSAKSWNKAELYWIVANGVKMTGMPAWGVTKRSEDIWDLVAFLETMPNMPPMRYQQLRLAAGPSLVPAPAQPATAPRAAPPSSPSK